ncbi:50S ribosomal protein P1 [Candidatus Nanohalobium constans]|uniref:Large ribosomal subunit protein P1 n=1 Tax=Candidatus Nanohalobium constans TaxID=2565781 RepID=A0A5Q0UEU0_9ARCH|nr:50S ribosomal protein P1 [Candidatus Nanohalobium constans]QGA80004.1 50S ribosomal protein L12 [Candidatus Nanohalobium constans]
MELIYAALTLSEADKEINEENLQDIVDAAGLDVEDSEVAALVAALEDVDIQEAMETAVAGGAAPAPSGDDSAEEADEEEEAEEEEEDEGDDEEAAEGLGNMF